MEQSIQNFIKIIWEFFYFAMKIQTCKNKIIRKIFYQRSRPMKNYWTVEEIEKLRNRYAEGNRIKLIAKELGRTPSAINKALSRLSISRRNTKIFTKKRNIKLHSNHTSKTIPQNETTKTQVNASFLTITKYLQSKGFQVSRFSDSVISNCYKTPGEIFKVGNTPMSKMKLLLFANKLRLENKEPIFSSREITWH